MSWFCPMLGEVVLLLARAWVVELRYVPQEGNAPADYLVKLASHSSTMSLVELDVQLVFLVDLEPFLLRDSLRSV